MTGDTSLYKFIATSTCWYILRIYSTVLDLTAAGHGALFAGFIPRTADVVGAAAHLFGHVEGQLAVARSVVRVKVPVAVALPHVCVWCVYEKCRVAGNPKYDSDNRENPASLPTHAVVPSVDLHVIHRADAGVVPDGVVALAGAADAWPFTLIDICTQREQHGKKTLLQ